MISICIISKNAASTLSATLDSTISFDEVILLDNGSTDQTLQIAKKYPNVILHHSPFIGFGPLRNVAAKLAKHDWIFALDCDEVISRDLQKALLSLCLCPNLTYVVPRHNFYNGKRIQGCGWGNETVARLYNKKTVRYSDDLVHESILATQLHSLSSPLLHTPYKDANDFLLKMQHYSSLFAMQYRGKRGSSLSKALWKSSFSFFKSFVLKRGLFCGKEGLFISLYNAQTTFYKYYKLDEANRELALKEPFQLY